MDINKDLIGKFNTLYKKTLKVTDPEELPLSDIRRLMFQMVEVISEITESKTLPQDLYRKWEGDNKNGPFAIFLRGPSNTQSWEDIDRDPLPVWRA